MIRSMRWIFVFFVLCSFLVAGVDTEAIAGERQGVVAGRAVAIQEEAVDSDVDEEDDEDEDDDEGFTNNPWLIDERKLFAAKEFQLRQQFAVKLKRIDDVCQLDKKQKLKLSVAAKGATEKALDKYVKQWEQQVQQFGGFQQNDDDSKKKKRRKRSKKFKVTKISQIDAQIVQMLEGHFFGGIQQTDITDVSVWKRVVKKTLSEDQFRKLESEIESLKLAKRNERADTFISKMKMELALGPDQLEEFDKLVRPAFLKKDVNVSWQYDSMATLYFGSKFDKKKMKKLLTEEQYVVLSLSVKSAENYAGWFDNEAVNNGIVVRGNAMGGDPISMMFDQLFSSLDDFAELVGSSMEGFLNWAL